MLATISKFWKDEEGATAVEYGLMVAAIAAIIVIVVFTLGKTVSSSFDTVNSKITSKG